LNPFLDKRIAAIVTVRTSSKRLKKKCYKKLFDELSMIEIVIRRAKKIGCLVILATSDDPSDDGLEKIANKEGVSIFRGAVINKIHRWFHCFEKFDLHSAMLIDADDPSFSYSLARRSLEKMQNSGAEFLKGTDNLMPGFITYGISREGISKLYLQAKNSNTDTDVIDVFIERASLDTILIEPLPSEKITKKIRLTVDYEEDLEFYRKLFNLISYLEESSEMVKKIIEYKISQINWFRHEEFIKNQQNFNKLVNSSK
jgi:spore coat polysaccharide biosynthesis protein SpsF